MQDQLHPVRSPDTLEDEPKNDALVDFRVYISSDDDYQEYPQDHQSLPRLFERVQT